MGGKEITEIIHHLEDQLSENDLLVISPHRNILELRRYLNTSEFRLQDEISLKDEAQFYQILCLTKASQFPKVPLFGEKIWAGEVGEAYRKSQLKHFSLHQDPLSKAYVDFLHHQNS